MGASIIIWGTTVTFLQFFGYSIALGGLVWYKLGGETLKDYLYQIQAHSAKNPRIKLGAYAFVTLFFVGLLWFAAGPVYESGAGPTAPYTSTAI